MWSILLDPGLRRDDKIRFNQKVLNMKIFTAVLLTLLLTGCASVYVEKHPVIEWSEDVKLSDGRIIQLKRKTELTKSGFPLHKRGVYKSHSYCYEPMQIQWTTYGGYKPDIFDIVDGKAYLHLPISGCFTCEKYEYPETSALYFVWKDDHWTRIEHDAFPEQSEWNLLIDPVSENPKKDAKGHLTVEQKRARDSSLSFYQMRDGWKRMNESHYRKNACEKCRGVRNRYYGSDPDFPRIFVKHNTENCK
jgi:hypothetical protein